MMPRNQITMASRLKTVSLNRAEANEPVVDDEDTDIEPECQIDVPPHIPDGYYEVGFVRAQKKKLWGRSRVFRTFTSSKLETISVNSYSWQPLFLQMDASRFRANIFSSGRSQPGSGQAGAIALRPRSFEERCFSHA